MIISSALIGALIGALMFGGLALLFCSLNKYTAPKRIVSITLGATLAGSAIARGISVAVGMSPVLKECPEGTVQAGANNKLYSGCVPVELAKKQVENND